MIRLLVLMLAVGSSFSVELGLVYHLGNPYVQKADVRIHQDLGLLGNLGIHLRDALYWEVSEPSRGEFDFSGRIAPLKEYPVEILGLLAYSHPFYADHKFEFSPKIFPYFSRFVKKAIEAHPEIETWEILNEPNLTKYFEARDPVQTYLSLLRWIRPVFVEHEREVVAGSVLLEGDFLPWLKALLDPVAQQNYDILSLHVYCWPHSVRDFRFLGKTLEEWLLWIRERYNGKIFITEAGWPVQKEAILPLISPEEWLFRVQELCGVLNRHSVDRLYLYALEDDGPADSSDPFLHFGLQNQAGHVKFSESELQELKRACAMR